MHTDHLRYAFAKVSMRSRWTGGGEPGKRRHVWTRFELRVPDWILERADIRPADRCAVKVLEPGVLLVVLAQRGPCPDCGGRCEPACGRAPNASEPAARERPRAGRP
ncbi:MAG: hypothetical protein ACHQ4J_07330 [Candidatus Binatia bacterium]